jgi:PDZ domain-containing secreted protein
MKGYSMGSITLDFSESGLVVADTSSENAFGKKMGYKNGDKILKINGEIIKPWFLKRLFTYFDTLKEPEDLTIEVLRKDSNGKEKNIELKQKMFKVDRNFKNVIIVDSNPTPRQLTIRSSWLGEP